MMIFLLALFSGVLLLTIEIGVLAFITTIIVIAIAVIVKIIKNKQSGKTKS